MTIKIEDRLNVLKDSLIGNVEYKISILEAAIAGKVIQIAKKGIANYYDLEMPKDHAYDFGLFLYRIKPGVDRYCQYVVKTPDRISPCRVFVTVELFKSEADCQKEYEGHIILKRLSQIRVEI